MKPERDTNREDFRRENWCWFGRRHTDLREFLAGLPRYITTIETAKHRFFQFLDASILPDNKLINVGTADAAMLAVLSSAAHCYWFQANAGKIGVYALDSVYVKTRAFDPFPFPVCIDPRLPDNHPQAPLRDRLRALGERLDAFRKERLAAHDFLTMTGLYNVLERLRERESGARAEPPSASEKDIHEAGLVSVLKEIHDEIDRAVFEAYGFEDLGEELVGRPGATTPSAHKSVAQEAAEEELLTRLVALNLERHAEEKRGLVRWLRPDFQIPKLGHKVAAPQGDQLFADLAVIEEAGKPKWPGDGLEQIRIVRDILIRAPSPADAIAASFDGRTSPKRRERVSQVLESLVSMGMVRTGDLDGRQRYFVPR